MRDIAKLHPVTSISDVDRDDHDESGDHDQVGTVEVQILLSWFFETANPADISIDVPRAA